MTSDDRALGKTERVALLPGRPVSKYWRHRRMIVTVDVIFTIRWGKKRIEMKIKIRF